MFIHIVYIDSFQRRDREIIASTPDDAYSIITVLDDSRKVRAWHMLQYEPRHFGWTQDGWKKYRSRFTKEDFYGENERIDI